MVASSDTCAHQLDVYIDMIGTFPDGKKRTNFQRKHDELSNALFETIDELFEGREHFKRTLTTLRSKLSGEEGLQAFSDVLTFVRDLIRFHEDRIDSLIRQNEVLQLRISDLERLINEVYFQFKIT
jgi:hypothetical protein